MTRMVAIYRRELSFFFNSAVAYAVIFVFLLLAGYFFYNLLAYFNLASVQAMQNPLAGPGPGLTASVVQPLFGNLSVILMLILPLLTMRLFSEERKTGTAELLFTYPVSDWDAIVGKYAATATVYAAMLAMTLVYAYVLSRYAQPEYGPIATGYAGLLLLGLAYIAMGLFFSTLSENQLVAGVATFGCGLLFLLIGWVAPFVPDTAAVIVNQLSLLEHFAGFAKGVLDINDVVFYANVVALFLFLSARVLDSNRWRG
jgi:ABC-2 type transport system permease protein